MLDPQGDILRKKEETKRTQRRIVTKYPLDDSIDLIGSTMIEYTKSILGSFNRVIDRYVALEKTLDDWKTLLTDVWEGSEEELVTAISKQDEGFSKYDKEYVDMTRKYDTTIERCKNISIKASQGQNVIETAPPSTNENRPNGAKPQMGGLGPKQI